MRFISLKVSDAQFDKKYIYKNHNTVSSNEAVPGFLKRASLQSRLLSIFEEQHLILRARIQKY